MDRDKVVKPIFTYATPCPLLGRGCEWRVYYCDTHRCYQPFYRFSRAHIDAGIRECLVCEEAKAQTVKEPAAKGGGKK